MRRVDSTLIALVLLFLVAAGLVSCFFLFTMTLDSLREPNAPPTYVSGPSMVPPFIPTAVSPALDPRPSAVSQTLEGITVNVQPRYADPSSVVLTFTVSGPVQPYPYGIGLAMYDQSHRLVLDEDIRLPLKPESRFILWQMGPSGITNGNEGYLVYDTSVLNGVPETLTMHLTLPMVIDNASFVPPVFVPTAAAVTAAPGTYHTATPVSTPPPNKTLTFNFDLATQVDRRCRVAQVNETVQTANVKMTLNYVSITGSEMRFELSYVGGDPNAGFVYQGGGTISGALFTDTGAPPINILFVCEAGRCSGPIDIAPSLLDEPEKTWTLTVNYLSSSYGSVSGPQLAGPWQFRFDMPSKAGCTAVPTPVGTKTP